MQLDHKLQLKNYLFWAVVAGLIGLAAMIVLPFIVAILSAYILAYLVRPLFLILKPKLNTQGAALLCVLVAILLVVIPISLVMIGIVNQTGDFVSQQNITHYIKMVANDPSLRGFNLNEVTLQTQYSQLISNSTASLLNSLPLLAVGLIITLIGT